MFRHRQQDESPLYAASRAGHADVVLILIEAGASIDQACYVSVSHCCSVTAYTSNSCTNLHYYYCPRIIMIIQRGVTSLGVACEKDHTEVARLLIEAGASIDHEDLVRT